MKEASVIKITTKEDLLKWISELPVTLMKRELRVLLETVSKSKHKYIAWWGHKEFRVW